MPDIFAEMDKEMEEAEALAASAQDTINDITDLQPEAETDMNAAVILANQTDLAQDVAPSTLDRRPEDAHPVVLLLFNTILSKIKKENSMKIMNKIAQEKILLDFMAGQSVSKKLEVKLNLFLSIQEGGLLVINIGFTIQKK